MMLEVHVRRNMTSRTRPEVFYWDGREPKGVQLHAGSGEGEGRVRVDLSPLIPIDRYWCSLLASVYIDDIALTSPRPGVLFLESSDIPTLVHFPSLAPERDMRFGGWWTVALRTIER